MVVTLGAGRRAVLIAGPTASGKSALAARRARELGGVVVNTDALQVYQHLRVLTARPSPADEQALPHRLYGIVPPAHRFSTGAWARAAAELCRSETRPLIFVGGTGLYFESLTNGFAEVPEVSEEIVAQVEADVAPLDRAGRARLIAERDPLIAERLHAPDPQRVVRALAVLEATGRSLAHFQDAAATPPILQGFETERILLDPGRDELGRRIAGRFDRMLEKGAIEEVRALLALKLDPSLPVMKAIGIREIGAWLAGTITREEAVSLAVTATRQYAKRQRTWFRRRMAGWTQVESV